MVRAVGVVRVVFDRVVIVVVAAIVSGRKMLVRPLMQLVQPPVEPVEIQVDKAAVGRATVVAHAVLHVGGKRIHDDLRRSALRRTFRVVPAPGKVCVEHERVELPGRPRTEKRIAEACRPVGLPEGDAQRELVRLPPVGTRAPDAPADHVDRRIGGEFLLAVGGEELHGDGPPNGALADRVGIDALPGNHAVRKDRSRVVAPPVVPLGNE